MKNITKIYLITNCFGDSNKVYIGKTKNCRKNSHIKKFGNQIIYEYIDEINSLKRKDWEPLETKWIQYYKNLGYEVLNKNKGGGGPEYWSDEFINSKKNQIRKEKISNNKERGVKISKALKGRKYSKETIQKMSKPKSEKHKQNMSKPRTNETKQKISLSLKGRKSPVKGIKLSDNRKKIISEKNSKIIFQYDLNNNFIKEWKSIKEAANFYNVDSAHICNCLKKIEKGIKATSCGYIWKYK